MGANRSLICDGRPCPPGAGAECRLAQRRIREGAWEHALSAAAASVAAQSATAAGPINAIAEDPPAMAPSIRHSAIVTKFFINPRMLNSRGSASVPRTRAAIVRRPPERAERGEDQRQDGNSDDPHVPPRRVPRARLMSNPANSRCEMRDLVPDDPEPIYASPGFGVRRRLSPPPAFRSGATTLDVPDAVVPDSGRRRYRYRSPDRPKQHLPRA
jgi:hypothetical protein